MSQEIQQAHSDIADAKVLRVTAAFDRYFMRRLRQMLADKQKATLEGSRVAPVMISQRDLDQRDYQLLKSIVEMMDNDDVANRSIVEG